jgi:hypothetical protein
MNVSYLETAFADVIKMRLCWVSVALTMYTHVSKCKNDNKRKKKIKI